MPKRNICQKIVKKKITVDTMLWKSAIKEAAEKVAWFLNRLAATPHLQRHIYAAAHFRHSNESPLAPGFALTLIAAPSENFPSSSSFASGFST